MPEYEPGLKASESIDELAEGILRDFPRQLGIPEIIPGCEVTDLDPRNVGLGVAPRYVTIRISGSYAVEALWMGSPTIEVGSITIVTHIREGDIYQVVATSGAAGDIYDAEAYLHHWVYDISLGSLIAYDTIVGASGYAALASGDYILMRPGTFDESITLVNGVIFAEQVPGTTIIHSTSAAVAVTCVQGGYIQCKEIQVTNASANIYAVYSNVAAGECNVFAEHIEATGDGTNAVYGVYHENAGTLNVYTKENIEAHDGDGATIAVHSDAGTLNVYCDGLVLVDGGIGSWSIAVNMGGACTQNVWAAELQAWDDDYCVGAEAASAGTQVIHGKCYADTNGAGGGDWAAGAECWNNGTVQIIYGECEGVGDDDGHGAFQYRGTQTIHGDCIGTAIDAAGTSVGSSTGNGTQVILGRSIASGGSASYGAYCYTAGVQRAHGDVAGDDYGARCTGGTQTITCGRASGATFDLIRTGGTLQVFMVEFDTYSGTITQYYPGVDDFWIGIAGGSGARIDFDATPATDVINHANCDVGVNEPSPDRKWHATVIDAVTNAITYIKRLTHDYSGGGSAAALFGLGEEHELEDAAGNLQVASEWVTLWAAATSGSESPLLRGTTYPAGSAGPGYCGFWTWNALDNNARTFIPNGTGDVTAAITIHYTVAESGGGYSGSVVVIPNNSSANIYDDGTDIFTVTINADGSAQIARSAGATTAKVALWATWI